VQRLALRDALTGLRNRRALANILRRRFLETERYGTPLCLIMADLDHFKSVNDCHGHLAGDLLLKQVAQMLTRSVRAVDVVTRYGGEEFAIVLPETELSQGMILANRVRDAVARHTFFAEGVPVKLAVSMGVARIPDQRINSLNQLVAGADQALYLAKTLGRNRVEALHEVAVAQVPVRLGR
jgi:diguanylate cyclase (GGDEF)-like protein